MKMKISLRTLEVLFVSFSPDILICSFTILPFFSKVRQNGFVEIWNGAVDISGYPVWHRYAPLWTYTNVCHALGIGVCYARRGCRNYIWTCTFSRPIATKRCRMHFQHSLTFRKTLCQQAFPLKCMPVGNFTPIIRP